MSLVLHNVSKEYATRSGPLPILRGVTLKLDLGQAASITGPSGSGKSTLLHLLGTLDKPSAGTIEFNGENPFALNEKQLGQYRNKKIGFVFQDHHLLPQCNVIENVLIPTLIDTKATEAEKKQTREYAEQLLTRVGLKDRFLHRPSELSGGERQRVAVARALIRKPGLLLADEPTGNLDQKSAAAVGDLLLEMCRSMNMVLVCVTHSNELASRFPIRFAMNDGSLVK
jgi:lipoprotein-releasing system ATP-binding protein